MKGSRRWEQEVLAGLVMFFGVFPILRAQGNPVLFLAASLGTLIVSIFADLPLVVLPFLPLGALSTFLCEELYLPPEVAMGTLLLGSGAAFLVSLWPGWGRLFRLFPVNLRFALAGGFGLILLVRGFLEGRILVPSTSGWLEFGDFLHPRVLAVLLGILVAFVLFALRFKGAALFGMLTTGLFSFVKGLWSFAPVTDGGLQLRLFPVDVSGALQYGTLSVTLIGALLVFFEVLGLLGGFLTRLNEDFARFRRGICFGILGTLPGLLLGVPGCLPAPESALAIGERGKRGLAGIVCGGGLLFSFFFFRYLPSLPAFVAVPALCVGGFSMVELLGGVAFRDALEGIPAFCALGVAVATLSLAEGCASGILVYTVLSLILRRGKSLHPAFYLLTLFALIFFLIR
ncbi:hypothetical protein [Candidatus Caldatribacterium sp.]|uniref:hypothetical protein n=1 Tax=Candidatus Caldatribacterium sp. TaxID=2282143 RepID=UPI002996AF07|nr:hypothetical protein [Candidatus Caldatribacterium sp.]MDW8080368.1 hypothetical protein [Candidatus Calescibacterium sp.]